MDNNTNNENQQRKLISPADLNQKDDLDFDENGQLKGTLKDKQIKELTDRIITNNFIKNFGHPPTKEQLKETQTRVHHGVRTGLYAKVAQSHGLSPEMPKVANSQEDLANSLFETVNLLSVSIW